jgi:hypothetical protein
MLLPVKEAAEALGVSVSGVRRGLKSGRLKGQRRATPQGHVWLIEVPDDQAVTTRTPASRVPGDRATTRVPDSPDAAPDAPQEAPGEALLATRAQEMAAYTERLLAPWRAIVQQQAEEIGALKARLEAAPAPETQSAPSPQWETRRWWQKLLWG